MITTHKDNICKECQKDMPNFKDLLKHIAKHHGKEQVEAKGDGDIQEKSMKEESYSQSSLQLLKLQQDGLQFFIFMW